jgi:hypothetical protein
MQQAQHVVDQFILKFCLCEEAKQTAPAVNTVYTKARSTASSETPCQNVCFTSYVSYAISILLIRTINTRSDVTSLYFMTVRY